MASLQVRKGVYRLMFRYGGKQQTYTVGEVPLAEARLWKSRAEHLLMRIEQGMMEVPRGVSIADFILHDGKPPVDPAIAAKKDTTLLQLKDAYFKAVGNGALEPNTVLVAQVHMRHIERTFSKKFILAGLTLGRLQDHVNRRAQDVVAVTIKKEIDTFRAVWNWGVRMKWVEGIFPCNGLTYPKSGEKLPFMTWDEIERRMKAGGDPEELWECLYLDTTQVTELLSRVSKQTAPPWLYPMVATAGHTGARRSELMRAQIQDVNLNEMVLTVREMKRKRGTYTTRRVQISGFLAGVLKDLISKQSGKRYLFGDGDEMLPVHTVHSQFEYVLADSKWSVIKGWHTLRHSFISACASKGIDQRVLDDWVGHQTEQQRVRYRHLYPSVQKAAMERVFG